MLKHKFIYPGLLILVITGMYFYAVGFSFIGYDNPEYIIANPLLGEWSWNHFIEIWKVNGVKLENLYIPLTYVTYFFETALFGKTPSVIHLDNLILHATNCLLVFYFGKKIGLKPFASFLASLAFAIHPLQVEPVVWCMGRKDLLSTFFSLLCLLSFLSYSSKKEFKWIIVTIISGILSMLSKPVMVILPGILLLLELFFLNQDNKGSDNPFINLKKFTVLFLSKWKFSKEENAKIKGFVLRKVSIITLSLFSILTIYLNLTGSFKTPINRNFYENSLLMIHLLAGWVKRFLLFEGIEHFYRPPDKGILYSMTTGNSLILLIVLLVILSYIFLCKYEKKIIFGLLFFLIAFLPPLAHLKYSQNFITADRYGYFPLIGVFIAIAAFYENSRGLKRKLITVLLSLWFIFIFTNNIKALKSWSNDVNFWKLEVETKPESAVDNYFLGLSYQNIKDYKNALKHYKKCIGKENKYTQKALLSSGAIFFYIRKYSQAEIFYQEALNYRSELNSLIYYSLGETYRMQKKVEQAMKAYKNSLKLDNTQPEANLRIAQIYLYWNNKKLAEEYANKAIKLGIELTEDLKKFLENKKNEI